MAKQNYNYQLAKIHRSYSVEEVANLFDLNKQSVRIWIKGGLPTCDNQRPMLILGRDLRDFLKARRLKNKRPCPPGTIYCVRCREPKVPVDKNVIYKPITETKGSLIGICPDCDNRIYQITSLTKLEQFREKFNVTITQAD